MGSSGPTDSFSGSWYFRCQNRGSIQSKVCTIFWYFYPFISGFLLKFCISFIQKLGIRGYPTIMFINGEKRVEFKGERTLTEILDFATRISGPPIRYLSGCDQLNELENRAQRSVSFVNFGSNLDAEFERLAIALHQSFWFYRSQLINCPGFSLSSNDGSDTSVVYAIKGKGVAVLYGKHH